MSYPREQLVLLSCGNVFDIGNTATNAQSIPIPFKCHVVEAIVVPQTAVANAFQVGFNELTGGTLETAESVGNIVVPDSASALIPYKDQATAGKELDKHSVVMVDCLEAGDSGENAMAYLLVEVLPETDANEVADMIETA